MKKSIIKLNSNKLIVVGGIYSNVEALVIIYYLALISTDFLIE